VKDSTPMAETDLIIRGIATVVFTGILILLELAF
jgi:hypothetical protein